ncbi:response regulator transcription factor [Nocardia sp. NPDC052566]|uniref:response regulator transcription factor n=1 Tax=Nocardia sp. NPDC052566 TaxID=3364330 RepID=UPI0037CB03C9
MTVLSSRILLVEKDESIRISLEHHLVDSGHVVLSREHGELIEQDLSIFSPDLVVFDAEIPRWGGRDLLEAIRHHAGAHAVILSGTGAVEERVRGLTAGADDYIVKPFAVAELGARIDSLLRRAKRTHAKITVADLVIDMSAMEATRAGAPIPLTATEFKILAHLALHQGQTRSKNQILGAVWGSNFYQTNLVEVFVCSMRRKLGADGAQLLRTVRGRGYVLTAE